MQARGPLMTEHRLIEKMIRIIDTTLPRVQSSHEIDPEFIDIAVDFIHIYADKTHHGKEEDILFRKLSDRKMSREDRLLMDELIQEHVFGRQTTHALAQANSRYRKGEIAALDQIVSRLRTLVNFYPRHIWKEDKIFFPAARAYFTDEEEQEMIAEFYELDRRMIHEKYKEVVQGFDYLK